MSDGATVRRSHAEKLALGALSAAVVAIALVPGRLQLGPVPLDAVTVAVPLALLLSWPFLRELGASRVPGFLAEVPVLAFLAIALLGIPFSTGAGSSALTLLRYAAYPLLAMTVSAVAVRRGNLRVLSWAIFAAAFFSVMEAAYQALSLFSAAGTFTTAEGISARLVASFGNPNAFAEFLVVAIAVTIALALTERGVARVNVVLVGLAEIVALALTYSRGSLIALVVGLAAAALIVDVRWLGGLAAGLAVLLAVIPHAFARLVAIFTKGGGLSDRVGLWELALEMIRRHPLFGVGLGNYLPGVLSESASDPSLLRPGTQPFTPHNSFLTVAAETGILGGFAFAWVATRILRGAGIIAVRLERGSREWRLHAAFVVGLVGFVVASLTDNAFQNPRGATVFWVLLGLVIANGAAALRVDAASTPGRDARLWWMPRTRGRLLLDSRVGRALLGKGTSEAGNLEPWEVVRG